MAIPTSISRAADYYRRRGLRATIARTMLGLKRTLFSNRAVVFYCDLSKHTAPSTFPKFLKVEQKKSFDEIDPQDLHQIISFWNPRLAHRRMEERFGKGASLWLIRFNDRLAGFGWTLRGRVIAPYYLPLAQDDVQFFDFHVFPNYRGRAIDWFLMTHILGQLATEGAVRAFAEAAEWNRASLSSISTTPFRRLGRVRMLSIAGHRIVSWEADSAVEERQEVRRLRCTSAANGDGKTVKDFKVIRPGDRT